MFPFQGNPWGTIPFMHDMMPMYGHNNMMSNMGFGPQMGFFPGAPPPAGTNLAPPSGNLDASASMRQEGFVDNSNNFGSHQRLLPIVSETVPVQVDQVKHILALIKQLTPEAQVCLQKQAFPTCNSTTATHDFDYGLKKLLSTVICPDTMDENDMHVAAECIMEGLTKFAGKTNLHAFATQMIKHGVTEQSVDPAVVARARSLRLLARHCGRHLPISTLIPSKRWSAETSIKLRSTSKSIASWCHAL
jgi:hypothetical protein